MSSSHRGLFKESPFVLFSLARARYLCSPKSVFAWRREAIRVLANYSLHTETWSCTEHHKIKQAFQLEPSSKQTTIKELILIDRGIILVKIIG